MSGRPLLFPDGKQISVLVSSEDYRTLSKMVKKTRVVEPHYTYGDLLRSYIRRGLETTHATNQLNGSDDPKSTRVRRLHAIARAARDLAQELETAEKSSPRKRTQTRQAPENFFRPEKS